MTDFEIIRGIITERRLKLNPYTPFSERLKAIGRKLDRCIEEAKELS